jgi:hypothetical protein
MNEIPMLNKYPEKWAFIDYDVFEEFPNGATLWRACVCGMKEVESKMIQLRKETPNKLFALNLKDGRDVPAVVAPAALPATRTLRRVN